MNRDYLYNKFPELVDRVVESEGIPYELYYISEKRFFNRVVADRRLFASLKYDPFERFPERAQFGKYRPEGWNYMNMEWLSHVSVGQLLMFLEPPFLNDLSWTEAEYERLMGFRLERYKQSEIEPFRDIRSAEEYKALRESPYLKDHARARNARAPYRVWIDIIEKYPHLKMSILNNKHIPIHICMVLGFDVDPAVRYAAALKRCLPAKFLLKMSKDRVFFVRHRVALNRSLPITRLKEMCKDANEEVRDTARWAYKRRLAKKRFFFRFQFEWCEEEPSRLTPEQELVNERKTDEYFKMENDKRAAIWSAFKAGKPIYEPGEIHKKI